MRILVKVDAYHNGEPTKAGTVIEVDDVDAIRWIREQTGIEWRPTRIYPSRDLGKILGVNPLDLKLPKEWYVTVQHLHNGIPGTRKMRRGAPLATRVTVRQVTDHSVLADYTAIPRKGDRPSRAIGLQVGVGRAIILAFGAQAGWSGSGLLGLVNKSMWKRFTEEAKAFMREPGNENTRNVFSKQRDSAQEHDFSDGIRGKYVMSPKGLRELFAEGPLGRHEARRKTWAELSLQQAHQAKDLLYRQSEGVAPSIKECASRDYVVKDGKVVGMVPKVNSGHPTDTDQVYVVEWMTWDEVKEAKNKDLKSHVLQYLKTSKKDVTKPRTWKYGISDGTVRSIKEDTVHTEVRESQL